MATTPIRIKLRRDVFLERFINMVIQVDMMDPLKAWAGLNEFWGQACHIPASRK